ncbi:MAG: hypothetical protein WA667_10965 [Candidatus Nitrosopolaris sp.]
MKTCNKCDSTNSLGQWYFANIKQEKRRFTMCKQCFFVYCKVKDKAGYGGSQFDWGKADRAGEEFLKRAV